MDAGRQGLRQNNNPRGTVFPPSGVFHCREQHANGVWNWEVTFRARGGGAALSIPVKTEIAKRTPVIKAAGPTN